VLLPRRASPYQESYRRHFRCPVRFNQEMAAIAVPARDLDHRVTEADPLPRALLAERVRPMKGSPGSEFPDDIRRLLRMRLTSNRCSADEIARQLLHNTQVPLAQIAAALSYSDASAFARPFRRWSGQKLTAWRDEGPHE
jgi:hypothetical protein